MDESGFPQCRGGGGPRRWVGDPTGPGSLGVLLPRGRRWGAGRASPLASALFLLPVDTAGLARAPLRRRGAGAFQRSLVGSAGQTCPSVGAGGGCSSPQQRCLGSGAILRQVCRRACFQRRAVNTAQSSFPSEIIFQLGVLGRGTCARRRHGPQLAGGSQHVPGPRRQDGGTAGRRDGRGAREPCCWQAAATLLCP